MFTLVCAIIPAAGLIPSALAQEDITSLAEEDLARGNLSYDFDRAGDGSRTASSWHAMRRQQSRTKRLTTITNNEFGDDEAANLPRRPANQRAGNLDLDLDLIPRPNSTDPATPDEEPSPECPTGFTFNTATDECEQRQIQATICELEVSDRQLRISRL